MALDHARSGQVVALQPQAAEPAFAAAGARSHALFKSAQLEVMRLVLAAGSSLGEHSVPGELTLQCLQGSASVVADGSARPLRGGELLYLRGGVAHSVRAVDDCVLLLTLVLCGRRDAA